MGGIFQVRTDGPHSQRRVRGRDPAAIAPDRCLGRPAQGVDDREQISIRADAPCAQRTSNAIQDCALDLMNCTWRKGIVGRLSTEIRQPIQEILGHKGLQVQVARAYPSGTSATVCSRRRRQGMIHPSVRCRP